MFYFVKTPWLLRKFYPARIWNIPSAEKIIYLTFDDGPHPIATLFVLEELKKYNAKATFFCIGKNVIENPELFNRILQEGHQVGNHTHHHVNGWKCPLDFYLDNVTEAKKYIGSTLFRPPYGRMTSRQAKKLMLAPYHFKIIMWDILSGDFDLSLSAQKCIENVVHRSSRGSIIVFHDSLKSLSRVMQILPTILELLHRNGYRFEKIEG